MIKILIKDVIGVAPEFKAFAETEDGPDAIKLVIGFARSFVNESRWGSRAKLGICLMTAHLMKELGYGGAPKDSGITGAVTSEKVGDLQRSYGQINLQKASDSNQLLITTTYGKTFLMLRKMLLTTPIVT